MSYLLSSLPPFAADYSGVASALHDLGGLVVIHDASGCTGSYTGYDEPRWFTGRSSLYCSGLREFDAIMGNDQKLLDNIVAALDGRQCRFVAVIASPVPMLVGFDVHGFADLVQHETGLPAFGFPTTGLGLYDKGLSSAYLTLARRIVGEPRMSRRQGANVLGASPLDDFDAGTMALLERFLARVGLPLVSTWGQGSDFRALARAAEAAVNLVVSASAMPLARYMEERWGIPFVTGLPMSPEGEEEVAAALMRAADGAGSLPGYPQSSRPERRPNGKVLLVGEVVRMAALRAELRRHCQGLTIHAASFFAWDAGLAEDGDCFLADEEHAMTWLAAEDADVVVGDPLLEALLPPHARHRFFSDPHRAVSARLHRFALSQHFGSGVSAFKTAVAERLRQRVGSLAADMR